VKKAERALTELFRWWWNNYQSQFINTEGIPGINHRPRDENFHKFCQLRGLSVDTASKINIGYASYDDMDKIMDQFRPGVLEALGLVVEEKQRFKCRIIFPVRDWQGVLRGFVGRRVGEKGPKWLDQPLSDWYDKFLALLNIENAAREARTLRYSIVVEGPMDVLDMRIAGFRAVVSPLGTKMTSDQARILARFTDRVYIFADGDMPGQEFAEKCAWQLKRQDVATAIVKAHDKSDPSSMIHSHGPRAVMSCIKEAKEVAGW